MIVLCALWIAAVVVNAEVTESPERQMVIINGRINLFGQRVFLSSEQESYQLLLLPSRALDSLGLAIRTDDQVEIEGEIRSQAILVYKFTVNDTTRVLRDEQGQAVVPVTGGLRVIPSQCISCRLCVNQCPMGAISFVRRKAVIDPEKCIECYICVDGKPVGFKGCPVGAIKSN